MTRENGLAIIDRLFSRGIVRLMFTIVWDNDENHVEAIEAHGQDDVSNSFNSWDFENDIWEIVDAFNLDTGIFELDTQSRSLVQKGEAWMPEPHLETEYFSHPREIPMVVKSDV